MGDASAFMFEFVVLHELIFLHGAEQRADHADGTGGIEHMDDIIEDLSQALEAAAPSTLAA